MKAEPLTKEKKEIERILALLSHAESLWCGEKVTLIFLSSNDAEEFQTLFEKHKEKLLELSGSPLLELLTTKKEMRLKEKVKKKVKQRVNQLLQEIEKMKRFYEDKTKEYLNKGDIDSAEIFTAKRDTAFRIINKIKQAFSGVVEE